MVIILLTIIGFLINSVCSKLVIEHDQVKEYGIDTFKNEGELVETYIRDHPTCGWGVEEEVTVYKYFVTDADGHESEDTATIATVLDITYDVDKLCNIQEKWICMDIKLRPYLNCFEQDDQFLISTLKKDFLKPPPPTTTPYNFTKTENWDLLPGQYGQPIYLDRVIFKEQVKNGFFIEAGADDFEQDSNTILFEMKHGWTGLLVEPNPTIFPKGFLRHRKAWASSSCLATETRPHIVNFAQRLFEGGMAAISPERTEETYQMQCMPLYSLLMAAAGNITVNYLSLDIEGAEFLVLRTIPWDKVDIEVVTVETNHAGEVFPGTKEEIREYMAEQGYVYHNTVAVDDVFVRKDLYEGKYSPDLEMKKWFDKKMDIDEIIKELKETNIIKDVIDIQSEKDEL